jgi:tetrapyrrole methylase family protein / MazG family protein
MSEFNNLLDIANILLSEKGCEWDKKQTFDSLKLCFIEEAYELIDAVDEKDNLNILEELGDLLYLVVFFSKIAQKKDIFNLDQVIKNISEKLIRRHPHIFADKQVKNVDEILQNWEEIKKTEDSHKKRKNLFDNIPKSMSALMKAQKIISILKQKKIIDSNEKFIDKKEFEEEFISLIIKATISGYDLETTLNHQLKNLIDEKNIS